MVSGLPERIVAAAALQIHNQNAARLHLCFRTRFCTREYVTDLLNEIESVARREDLRNIHLVFPEKAPWRLYLEEAGFTCDRTDEWWMCLRNNIGENRIETAARLIGSTKLSKGITMSSLRPEDFGAVRALSAEHGLAELERLGHEQMLANTTDAYDPHLSAVVRLDGDIAGILLVKRLGDTAFIHMRAVAKKYHYRSKAVNAHLMARFNEPQYQSISRFIFTARPAIEKETIAMAKRIGSQKIGGYCRYSKQMESSGQRR
ncbi:MAG: hypothetical protein JJU05_05940 [Verrucomicrobia bacterium]|nr:hypothetical protein [Verrucomicrobiota bacterium]MCH8525682.1 hypothetical protein [Kiritimatiellia bacterium]